MTEDEKDMIDLEVTSFMTACAAGVDALKAVLQKERLRRMEQEASARAEAGVHEEDGAGRGSAGELQSGSRPAHENALVTFLFERLKAVTEVAETMQVSCRDDAGEREGIALLWLVREVFDAAATDGGSQERSSPLTRSPGGVGIAEFVRQEPRKRAR